mmetsp:Transcript_35452/g.89293  ORF Transcript_35452/g.89293 Transcript_35452/m.89293 type:complete len:257 (-) Transcript_35452:37-807(-)
MDLKSGRPLALAAGITGAALGVAWLWKSRSRRSSAAGGLTPWKGNFGDLRPQDAPSDGRELFSAWLQDAERQDGFSARVMAVATSSPEEGATVRSVIFHTMHEDGSVVFGTNSTSQKARSLNSDPRCELLFRWGDRQIRVRGRARCVGDGPESDAAFKRLPRHCQLGLLCLRQGTSIDEGEHGASLRAYEDKVANFGLDPDRGPPVPRPANYTAVVVEPHCFEFYQGGKPGYINDRFLFVREAHTGAFPLKTRLQA